MVFISGHAIVYYFTNSCVFTLSIQNEVYIRDFGSSVYFNWTHDWNLFEAQRFNGVIKQVSRIRKKSTNANAFLLFQNVEPGSNGFCVSANAHPNGTISDRCDFWLRYVQFKRVQRPNSKGKK